MTWFHFSPIQDKTLDIIDKILKAEEMVSLGGTLYTVRLVVEELVVNVVNYSGSDYLDVGIMRDKEHVTFRFRDGGVAFNPLEHTPPDVSKPLEERKPGGLGIFLVIQKAEHIEYEYTQGENVLTVSLII